MVVYIPVYQIRLLFQDLRRHESCNIMSFHPDYNDCVSSTPIIIFIKNRTSAILLKSTNQKSHCRKKEIEFGINGMFFALGQSFIKVKRIGNSKLRFA